MVLNESVFINIQSANWLKMSGAQIFMESFPIFETSVSVHLRNLGRNNELLQLTSCEH